MNRLPHFMPALLLTVSCVILVVAGFFEISSPDIYWHLRMGADLRHGVSPFFDHYSFTFYGAPIHYVAWPFQAVIALFYQWGGGLVGVDIYRIFIWLAALAILALHLRKRSISLGAQLIAVSFFLLVVLYHSEPRPEIASYVFELLVLWLAVEWQADPNWKNTLKLFAVMALWTNWHLSSLMGFVIAGAFALEVIGTAVLRKDRQLPALVLRALLIGAAGFANRDFLHPLIAQAQFDPRWAEYISEFHGVGTAVEGNLVFVYLILLAPTLAFLLQCKRFAPILIILVLASRTVLMAKLFPHLVLMSVVFVAEASDWLRPKLRLSVWWVAALALGCAVLTEVFRVLLIHPYQPSPMQLSSKAYFPVEIVDYIQQKNQHGKIFNDYTMGGFLIHELSPQMQVFIDGRTNTLYPIEFMELYRSAISDIGLLHKQVDAYDIDYALAPLDSSDELLDTALDSGLFNIEFMNHGYAWLTRQPTVFSVASRLFVHPECLERSALPALKAELQSAEILPSTAPLHDFLHFAVDYLEADRPQRLFQTPNPVLLTSLPLTRLAARLAEKASAPAAAEFYYANMAHPSQEDKIHRADLDCRLHACANAESILQSLTAPRFGDHQRFRAYQLLMLTQSKHTLKIFNADRIERLHQQLGGREPGAPDWCQARATTK